MAERKADMETWTEAYAWFLLAKRHTFSTIFPIFP